MQIALVGDDVAPIGAQILRVAPNVSQIRPHVATVTVLAILNEVATILPQVARIGRHVLAILRQITLVRANVLSDARWNGLGRLRAGTRGESEHGGAKREQMCAGHEVLLESDDGSRRAILRGGRSQ